MRGNTVPLSVSNMVGGATDKSSRAVGAAMRDCGGCDVGERSANWEI